MRKSILSYLPIFVLFSLFLSACVQEKEEDTPPAPELPTAEMFVMKFDDFEDADTTKSFNNWFHAATNVVVWNTVIALNTAIPVAAFYESFNHDAAFQGNNTWQWSYSYPLGNDTYNARLVGRLNGANVEWEMFIAKQNGFSEVLWYEGTTKVDRSAANWTLNHNPNAPESLIAIEYERINIDGNEQITYTNVIPNSADNGDFITYYLNTDATFDANYDIFRTQQNNMTAIKWNRMTKDGRVKDPVKFGNDDWHCWDVELQDVDCL